MENFALSYGIRINVSMKKCWSLDRPRIPQQIKLGLRLNKQRRLIVKESGMMIDKYK